MAEDPAIVIRDGEPSDADDLTAMVLRSKAHWGYDDAFMRAVTDELRVTREKAAASRVAVDTTAGIVGMSLVGGTPPVAELSMLFVDPVAMGKGVGSLLLRDALARAQRAGISALEFDADPSAAPFYAARGAVIIGEAPSESIPGRMLPRMSIPVT